MKNFLFLLVVLIIIIHLCYKLEFYDGTYSDIETDTSNTSQNTIEYDMDVEITDSSENNVITCSNIYDNTPDCEMSAEQYVNLESEMVVDPYDPNNLDDATNQSHLAVYNTSVQDEANLLNQLSEFTYNEESDIYEPHDRVSVHPDVSGSSANEESVNTNYTTYITDNENAKKNIENITEHEQSKYSSLDESTSTDGMTINDVYGDLKVFCTSTNDDAWNESLGIEEEAVSASDR